MKSSLETGEIGSIRLIQASGKGYYGGYGLMNIGIHLINACWESPVTANGCQRMPKPETFPSPLQM